MEAKKFELFMGCLGNGVTVCNKAVEESGDYKRIAHISPEGEIKWYVPDDYTPPEARAAIERAAAQEKEKHDKWWNSLPEAERYERTLDKMTASELVEHIRKRRVERGANRYQVITYSRDDGGADEKLEYKTVDAAERAARSYVDGFEDSYDGAIVYDLLERRIVREIGYFADNARPTEG